MIKLDYELLDSGAGYRLERFGNNVVARPDSSIIWSPSKPRSSWKYDGLCVQTSAGKIEWQLRKTFKFPWIINCGVFEMELRAAKTKNIGIFPEQVENWKWIQKKVKSYPGAPDVLNLFGYTGGATLAASVVKAVVCHVDGAKSIISWFKKNRDLSGRHSSAIRFMVDDCIKFSEREVKRKVKYDGIIMDPPAFGRGSKGEIFKFEKSVAVLLGLCKKLVKPNGFVVLNSYSMGYSPYVVANLLEDFFPEKKIECGELGVEETGRGRFLPCGVFARF